MHGKGAEASNSSNMQKSKSPAVGRRILPKKWRKGKLPHPRPDPNNSWSPQGSCVWVSTGGQQVTLTPVNMIHVSEAERLALQRLAVTRLQECQLSVNITIPKDAAKRKRNSLTNTLYRRANSAAHILDNLTGNAREAPQKPKVFGVPLTKCIKADRAMRHKKASLPDLGETSHKLRRSSSSSEELFGSSDSLDLDYKENKNSGGNLIEALSLPGAATTRTQAKESCWQSSHRSLSSSRPQVPCVVSSCIKHIETYGLHTVGIFRKGSSKKKTKELREEFDSGHGMKLSDEHNPHEVAALLKEYFRDLPEPLLTRELYSCFLATRKIEDVNLRLHCLHFLLMLLPAANRDTLWTLLKFLMLVTQHSEDSHDHKGQQVEGNKMDAHNLATLFGPNLLHKARGSLEKEYHTQHAERVSQSREVIAIVKDMIENYRHLFIVSAELYDQVLMKMRETNPEWVDIILRKKLCSMIEHDPDTQTSCSDGSLPRSPSWTSEAAGGRPKSFMDGMMHSMEQHQGQPAQHFHSVQPPPDGRQRDAAAIPESGAWYQPDSRGPSPRSPVLVHKQPKQQSQGRERNSKLRLTVPEDTSDRSRSSSKKKKVPTATLR